MPRTLLHTVAHSFETERPDAHLPWSRWLALIAVAVGGSCLYGGSLALVLANWNASSSAIWLAGSAGLAWCFFIPALCWITGRPWPVCLDACLVTMACGEVVLTSGAMANALLLFTGTLTHAITINACIVAISNVVMATTLALQLTPHGASPWRVLFVWMFVLNGTGAVFFLLIGRWLHLL